MTTIHPVPPWILSDKNALMHIEIYDSSKLLNCLLIFLYLLYEILTGPTIKYK